MIDTKLLRQKILDLAIRGKLVPQDPNDEPASVLLERIRKEKAELIKQGKIKKPKQESFIYKNTSDNRHYENVPFKVPLNWVWIIFGEICDYGSSDSATESQIPNDAWCLDLEDIEKDTAKVIAFRTKAERPFTSSKHFFKKGQVLYSKLRPYLNKVIIAPENGYCTSEILPLSFNVPICEEYVRHVLMSSYFLAYTEICARGIKMPRLGTNDGKKALFPLPPLAEQKRVAATIEALFEIIEEIETEQTELSALVTLTKSKILDLAMRGKLVPQDPTDEPASELLARISTSHKSHYQNFAEIPNSWVRIQLSEICDIRNGFTPLRSNKDFWSHGTVPWFTIADMRKQGEQISETEQHITSMATTKDRIVPMNSILVCCTASVGEVAFTKINTTTNQQFNGLTIKNLFYEMVCPEFIFAFAKTLKRQLNFIAGSTTFGFVPVKKLGNLYIPLPPLKEQKRIVLAIESIFGLISTIND